MIALNSEQIECSRAEAVALETVYGILAQPFAYMIEASSRAAETWVVRERVSDASLILSAARLPESAPESPRVKSPDHPFLACLYALEAHAALVKWSADPAVVPCFQRTRGKLCRVNFERILITAAPPVLSAFSVPDLRHAAALMVCGFAPDTRLLAPVGSAPAAVCFSGTSLTFPEIPRAAFRAAAGACRREGALGVDASGIVLGSFTAGEHPWCYAIQALANAAAVRRVQHAARRDPVMMMRGKGLRSAIVAQSLMEESCRDSSLRDAVTPHLRGV